MFCNYIKKSNKNILCTIKVRQKGHFKWCGKDFIHNIVRTAKLKDRTMSLRLRKTARKFTDINICQAFNPLCSHSRVFHPFSLFLSLHLLTVLPQHRHQQLGGCFFLRDLIPIAVNTTASSYSFFHTFTEHLVDSWMFV